MISTRSVGLLIDTVVCLTLAKWETVSGRFGGYLTAERRSRLELSDHRRLDPGDRDRQRSPPIGRSVRPVHYRNARLVPVRGGSFTLGSFFKLNLSKK